MSNPVAVHSLYGKRKRKKGQNPNPLFSKWLTEWMEEAREKGWKTEFIYSKALRSLRKFPLPLSSGKECKILQNFGDKICKMLDDRLLKHKHEQENQALSGLANMGNPSTLSSSSAVPAASSLSCVLPSVSSSSRVMPTISHVRPLAIVHEISDSSGDEGTSNKGLTHLRTVPSPSSKSSGFRPATLSLRTEERKETATTSLNAETVTPMITDSGQLQQTTEVPSISGANITNIIRHPYGEVEQEVTVVGHTSPAWTDSLEISDDDDGDLPTLPDLPGLAVRSLPRIPDFGIDGNGGRQMGRQPQVMQSIQGTGPETVRATVRETHNVSDSDMDEAGQAAQPQQARGRARGQQPKLYIPAFRSGAYAILLTLFRHAKDPDFRGFMTKAELSHAAQPLADKSFTVADPGSRYTAWSSVSTLTRKGLLTKESSPAKYTLTDEGYELAYRLEQAGAGAGDAARHHCGDEGRPVEIQVARHHHNRNETDVEVGAIPGGETARDNCSSAGMGSGHGSRGSVLSSSQRSIHTSQPSNSPVKEKNRPQTAASMNKEESTAVHEYHALRAFAEGDIGIGVDDGDDAVPAPSLPSLAQRLKPPSAVARSATSVTFENRGLQYWYVTEDDRLVLRKDQACASLNEDFGIGFLVKINYQHLLQSGSEYRLDMTRPLGDDYVFVYLSDAHCLEDASHPVSSCQKGCAASSRPVHDISDSDSETNSPLTSVTTSASAHGRQPPQPHTVTSSPTKLAATGRETTAAHAIKGFTAEASSSSSSAIPVSSSSTTMRQAKPKGKGGPLQTGSKSSFPSVMPRIIAGSDSQTSQSSVDSGISSHIMSEPVEDFVLYPGTFEIVLCVDNREFYGSNSSSKSLLPGLVSNGVNCDLRVLNVGDLLWVAREKAAPGAPLGMMGDDAQPARRELVLNYVVERKRMDDLVSSMISGRMKEQKFRLKHSGLQEKIILIESYGSMQHFSISEDRIKQGIANTAVIDGFTVKQTRDAKETAAYLTIMTRYLQGYYQNKTLRSCSQDALKELGIKCAVSDTEQILMPFDHFNQASLKSKPLTVLELFAKQLIQLHGMSADKAKAVVDRYPTPSSLFEAYLQCTTEKERDSLLANLKYGKNLRNLGISVSRQIRQLYTTLTLI